MERRKAYFNYNYNDILVVFHNLRAIIPISSLCSLQQLTSTSPKTSKGDEQGVCLLYHWTQGYSKNTLKATFYKDSEVDYCVISD